MEKFKLAVHYFEKHFQILDGNISEDGAVKERVKQSTAQVQLAISRANEKCALFFETVCNANAIEGLIRWKCERNFGKFEPVCNDQSQIEA